MTRGRRTGLGVLGSWVLAAWLATACSGRVAGELVLSFDTDMSIPKDVTHVVLSITSSGRTIFEDRYAVGPTGVKLPSTLGVLEGEKDEPVTIRIIALRGQTPTLVRESVSKVPKGRVAGLKIPIEWLCTGEENVQGTTKETATGTCPAGETCSAGSCVPATDVTLDDPYDQAAVFGGGDARGNGGTCFPVDRCFAEALTLEVAPVANGADCSFSLDGVTNVGLVPSDGAGVLAGRRAVVPLVEGSSGFRRDGATVRLPKAVCTRAAAGKLSVVASRACPPKTNRVPNCGPWGVVGSPVSVSDAGFDAPPPIVDAGVDADAKVPWREVVVNSRVSKLVVDGIGPEKRLYWADETNEIRSCTVADCPLTVRCEVKSAGAIKSFATRKDIPAGPIMGIVVVRTDGAVEAAASGACAPTSAVKSLGTPLTADVNDVGTLPGTLFLLRTNGLETCSWGGADCSADPTLLPIALPLGAGNGRLRLGSGLALLNGTTVGGCENVDCSGTNKNWANLAAGEPPLDVALQVTGADRRYVVVQEDMIASRVVFDCPVDAAPCVPRRLVTGGGYDRLAIGTTHVFLGGAAGLSRFPRPTPASGPQVTEGLLPDPVSALVVDAGDVFYATGLKIVRRGE